MMLGSAQTSSSSGELAPKYDDIFIFPSLFSEGLESLLLPRGLLQTTSPWPHSSPSFYPCGVGTSEYGGVWIEPSGAFSPGWIWQLIWPRKRQGTAKRCHRGEGICEI